MQHVLVQASLGPLHAFNTHFALPSDHDLPCVQANVIETLEHVRRRAEGSFVLMGDLGVEPDEPHLQRFRDAGLLDARALVHPCDPGHTWKAGAKGVPPSASTTSGPRATRRKVKDARHVDDAPADGVIASDHRGAVVTVDA